jgi:transposase
MEVVHPRCAGLDVSKKDAKACIRVQGQGRRGTTTTVSTWGSTTAEILALREHLIAEQVTCVVIESTSDYWKPFYYLLDDGLPVMLVNAKAARNVPGRKTDVSDAAWLAELGAHGLLRASFVPPEPIRVLRDLTRARTVITRERTKEIQRLEKLLEDTGIKLSAVASDIVGVSGRAMLEALIAGQRDPAVLADLAQKSMRSKIPALTEALRGRFNDHHAFMVRLYLDRIDAHSTDIARLDERIETAIEPFRPARELLVSIPGWSQVVANVFIAETGADMSVFPTAEHLASWAGVVPGCNESAGRVKSASTRPGNRHLKAALGVAALSAARSKDTYYSARYRRIAGSHRPLQKRRNKNKARRSSPAGQIALVAIEHKMLTDAYNMLVNGAFYRDPGPDYYTRHNPGKTKAKAIKQLEALGYNVILEPLTDAA